VIAENMAKTGLDRLRRQLDETMGRPDFQGGEEAEALEIFKPFF
jgi:hypothetical protein